MTPTPEARGDAGADSGAETRQSTGLPRPSDPVLVEVRIWQDVDDAENIRVGARLPGGAWPAPDQSAFEFEFRHRGSGRTPGALFDYPYGRLTVGGVTLAVSRDVHEPDLIYASACKAPVSCGLILVPLDGGFSPNGRYRYGDITLSIQTTPVVPRELGPLRVDRDRLLALRDVLPGTHRTLNWDPGVPITSWAGVTVGGDPLRVTKLNLSRNDLRGRLSGLLGDLTGLTELRLDGNRLQGSIPSKLQQLERLEHLHLGGNPLEGCLPPLLRDVPDNDVGSLGLPDCPLPPRVESDDYTLSAGTYRIGHDVVFDVPSNVRLQYSWSYGDPGGTYFGLNEVSLTPWIALTDEGGSSYRFTSSYRATHDSVFDRISESAWIASESLLAAWDESTDAVAFLHPPDYSYVFLTVASDGTSDSLVLEWDDGPPGAVRWQYSQGIPEGDVVQWSDWEDIPGSDGSTRSYRVSGLQAGQTYAFRIRPLGLQTDSLSGREDGTTQQGAGIPALIMRTTFIGDGVTEWRLPSSDYVITIPDGGRIRVFSAGMNRVTLWDMGSGALVRIETGTEEDIERSRAGRAGLSQVMRSILDSLRKLSPSR